MNRLRATRLGSWLRLAAASLMLVSAAGAQAPERAELRVLAVDALSGAPLPDLMVVACAGSLGNVRAFARTDEGGVALLGPLPVGAWLVATERRAPHAVTCEAVRIEPGAHAELTVAVGRGRSVSGVVRDRDGAPVADAEILWDPPFFPDRPDAAYHDRPPLVVGRSGADGRFTVDHLDEYPTRLDTAGGGTATIRLQARTPALESARTLPAALAASGASELKAPIVVRPVALRAAGEVRHHDGRPAAGVLVTANLARIDACSGGRDFGPHEDDDPFVLPPRFWEPGFELRAGEAITDERGRFELTVHQDACDYFRGPWTGRVCAVDRATRVARALTWGGREAQRPEDLQLVLPAATPAYLRFVLPDGASVERNRSFTTGPRSIAFLRLEHPRRDSTLLRTGDRPRDGALIELGLQDGGAVRSNRVGWGAGVCWFHTDAPLEEVRAVSAFVDGLLPVVGLEVAGLEVGRALEIDARPLPSVRLRLSPSESGTAARLDGTRWTAWACLAGPGRHGARGTHGPWWGALTNSERVEAGCCGLGTRHDAEWRGAQLELDVRVQADAPYWIYLARARVSGQPHPGVEAFGPFAPGDEVHERTLGSGTTPPRSPFFGPLVAPGTPAPEGKVFVRAVGADTGTELPRVDLLLRWSGGELVPCRTTRGDDGRSWLDLSWVLSRGERGSGVPVEVVAAQYAGHDPAPIGVALAPERADLDLGTVSLRRRPTLRARLVQPDGRPFGAPRGSGRRLLVTCESSQVLLEPDGVIEVEPGPPPAFVLEVRERERGMARYRAIDVRAWDPDEQLSIELPAVRPVELRVRGVDAARRFAALQVGVEPVSALPARRGSGPGWWDDPYGPTVERGAGAPDARSFFLELAPGRYRFTWRGVLFDFEETDFTVVPGADTQVVELRTR